MTDTLARSARDLSGLFDWIEVPRPPVIRLPVGDSSDPPPAGAPVVRGQRICGRRSPVDARVLGTEHVPLAGTTRTVRAVLLAPTAPGHTESKTSSDPAGLGDPSGPDKSAVANDRSGSGGSARPSSSAGIGDPAEASGPATRVGSAESALGSGRFDPAGPIARSLSDLAGPPDARSRIDTILEAGIADDRRLCPSLGGQLSAARQKPPDRIVINALDSDPTLRHNSRVLGSAMDLIVQAGCMLRQGLGATTAMLVVGTDADDRVEEAAKRTCGPSRVEFERITNPYPQADPTLLLHMTLGLKLRPGRLPTDLGVLLLDCPAAVGVRLAAECGLIPDHVHVAIRDHRSRKSHHLSVHRGTNLRFVFDHANIDTRTAAVWSGDLLRSCPASAQTVIDREELTFHITPAVEGVNPNPCIRCGWCADICPTRLNPAAVLDAAQRRDRAMADAAGLHACIDCGLCGYVCPSRLPLIQAIRSLDRRNGTAEGSR